MLRIPFETQGNIEFDNQEVENAPSSRLGQARQHKYKEGTDGKKLDIDFSSGLVAIAGRLLQLCQNVIVCHKKGRGVRTNRESCI